MGSLNRYSDPINVLLCPPSADQLRIETEAAGKLPPFFQGEEENNYFSKRAPLFFRVFWIAMISVEPKFKGSVLRIMEERALWRLDRGSTESQEYIGQKIF